MNIVIKCYCRGIIAFGGSSMDCAKAALPPIGLEIYGPCVYRKLWEEIPAMAAHAAREANPLYPVPRLMDASELELFYEKAADWSR